MILYIILSLQILLLLIVIVSFILLYPTIKNIVTLLNTQDFNELTNTISDTISDINENKDGVINLVNDSKSIISNGRNVMDGICNSEGIVLPLAKGAFINESINLGLTTVDLQVPSEETTVRIPVNCNAL